MRWRPGAIVARTHHRVISSMGEIMFDRPSAAARPERHWQPTKLFWIVAAMVLLLVVLFAASAGFGGVLFILGIVAVITGLYALLFKRQSWVGLPHRKSAGLVAASGVVAFIVGAGVAAAGAAPGGVPDKTALAATSQSATATPTATSPAKSSCLTSDETRKYNDELFICTMGSDQRLVWLAESESKRVVALKAAADKAAADKAAADKAAADKAAADKAAADKAAADKAAADKAAADKAAAQIAADKAAADKAARAPVAPVAPAAPAPAAGYVSPGAFCSGGTGVSKTGKAMICAPASDGRLRWRSA